MAPLQERSTAIGEHDTDLVASESEHAVRRMSHVNQNMGALSRER